MKLKDVLIKALVGNDVEVKKASMPVTEMREWDDYTPLIKSDKYLEQFFGWTYRGSKTIADATSSYPLELRKGDNEKSLEVKTSDNDMLRDLVRFNGYQDLQEARWITRVHLDMAGIAYWLISQCDEKEYKYEFFLLHPNRIKLHTGSDGLPLYYKYKDTIGTEYEIKPENLIVFREPDPNNWLKGLGALSAARLPHNTWELMQEFNMNFFGNNATPEGLLAFENINEDSRKKIELALKEKYGGTRNAGKMGVLSNIPTWIPLTKGQKELQYIEGIQNMRDEILGIMGVPKALVGLNDSTYNNSAEAQRIFQRYTLKPKLDREVNILNEQLIKKYYILDKKMTKDLFFERLNPVEADGKVQAEEVQILYTSGIIKLNEARERVGYEALTEGGDEFTNNNVEPEIEEEKPKKEEPKEDKSLKEVNDKNKMFMREELKGYFFRKAISQEESFTNVAGRFFKSQSKRILEQLNLEDKAVNYNPVIDWTAEDQTAIDVFWGLYEEIMKSAWNDADDLIGVDTQISPEAKVIIQNRVSYFAGQINKTTEKELAKILEDAVQSGKTSGNIAKDIQDLFDRWSDGGEGIDFTRANMIARTEVANISNSIMVENYRKNGVEGKEWLSAKDAFTRPDHAEADGQVVGINNTFLVGGEQLDKPGDPAGSAGNVINCRCVATPVLKL